MTPEIIGTNDDGARKRRARAIKAAGLLAATFGAGMLVGAAAQGVADRPSTGGVAAASVAPAASEPASEVAPEASLERPAVGVDRSADATDGAPAAAQPTDDLAETAPTPPAATSPAAALRLATLDGRLVQLRNDLERLGRRVVELERRQAAVGTATVTQAASLDEPPPLPVSTPEDRYVALLSVGVDGERADEILERQSRQELARLELRDRATREGWVDSDQYREAAAALRRNAVSLRGELGDSSYDVYLFNTGASNRMQIGSVMQGSAADEYGLQPGDVIEAYADRRVFNGRELREATTGGIRGEPVSVRIRRGDEIMEAWLPRGPIGVTLEAARVAPVP